MSKITHSVLSSYDPLFRILDAEEKGEQRNKSVANTVYLDIRRNELNKHTKESPAANYIHSETRYNGLLI